MDSAGSDVIVTLELCFDLVPYTFPVTCYWLLVFEYLNVTTVGVGFWMISCYVVRRFLDAS